ncbi:MAG: C25 family cysteine peptidase, partial [Caldilineaceae bacterium]
AASTSVQWTPTSRSGSAQPLWQDWPLVTLAGRQLPARLLTFAATGPASPQLIIDSLTSQANTLRTLPGQTVQASIPQPLGMDPRPDLAQPINDALPETPVLALRRGRMAGTELLVVAVSPLFSRGGSIRSVTDLAFTVTGASLWTADRGLPQTPSIISDISDTPVGPDPFSALPRLQIAVTEQGIQEIPLAALVSHKLISDNSQLPLLHLTHRGQSVAIEITDDLLRFYAPPPGDRWNQADLYWLVVDDSPGPRMQTRAATDPENATLPTQNWAWETGNWSSPALYDSTQAGQDGDHWFSLDLRSGPELPVITHTLPIPSLLPPLAASATVTLHVSGYTKGEHSLRISSPAFTETQLFWEGSGERSLSFAVDSRGQSLALMTVEGAAPDGVMFDSLAWQRPVVLRFGYTGGLFANGATETHLKLAELAKSSRLYDITDPRQPVRVEIPVTNNGTLLLSSAPHSRFLLDTDQTSLYLPLIGGGSTAAPEARLPAEAELRSAPRLELRPPIDLRPFLNADAFYIAPAQFHPALQPLLDYRASQGYQTALVDIQYIYAGWSGGHVDPAAIRDFVRWAVANSSRRLQALVLVGDATSDPHNYTGRNNTNFIPPYLLPVDPWLGETACDSCFGQVDGASPLDDILPDIPVGRIPAKSSEEVAFYVKKLLAYEQTPAPLAQRARMIFIADNFQDASGRVDGAGDFALSADGAVAQQPERAVIERVYFDPSPTHSQAPWREANPVTAWRKTLDALNRGGGFASYIGHAHQWQLASTDLNAEPPYLLGLYDADGLTNEGNLPVLLEMSCLTGMFQLPAFSGTTIDERLLLHTKGGAAAIWSSTGFGVAYGHDALQRGFYRHFWSLAQADKRLGALTQAGYLALFAEGLCCQESLRTFVILGDPLTRPQAAVEHSLWMPTVGH